MVQSIALRRIARVIKALRITEWRAYVGMTVYGSLLASRELLDFLKTLPILTMAIFLYMASAYLANNVFDVEGDRLNERKSSRNPFTTNLLSRTEGLVLVLVMSSLGMSLVMMTTDIFASASYVIGLLIALMYSIPPARLKERSPLDLISHSIFFGVALVSFGFHVNGNSLLDIYLLTTIAIYSTILELRNEIEDLDADKEAGYRTTAVVLGHERSVRLLKGLFITFVLVSLISLCKVNPLVIALLVICLTTILVTKTSFDYKVRLMDAYAVIYYLVVLIVNAL